MDANKSVLEFLSTSSQEALEAFRMSRLDRASRLRANIAELNEQWVQAQAESCIAEWILDRRHSGDPLPRLASSGLSAKTLISDLPLATRAAPADSLATARGCQQLGQLALRLEASGREEERLATAGMAELAVDAEPDGGEISPQLAILPKRPPGRLRLLAFLACEATATRTLPKMASRRPATRAHRRGAACTDATRLIGRCTC